MVPFKVYTLPSFCFLIWRTQNLAIMFPYMVYTVLGCYISFQVVLSFELIVCHKFCDINAEIGFRLLDCV